MHEFVYHYSDYISVDRIYKRRSFRNIISLKQLPLALKLDGRVTFFISSFVRAALEKFCQIVKVAPGMTN